MAKKRKRRRLKKSVRRGCALVLAVPLLALLAFSISKLLKGLDGLTATEESPSVEYPQALMEIDNRLDHLFQLPHRIDTSTVSIEVYDIDSETTLYSRHADRLAPPASCMKLVTAVAAMQYLGTDYPYISQVTHNGERTGSVLWGTLRFQFADDPLLESLEPAVDALLSQGITRIEGNIQLDLFREDTLKAHPTAAVWDIPYSRLPILLKGRQRIEQDLRYLLAGKGIACDHLASISGKSGNTGISGMSEASEESAPTVLYRHETPLTDVLAPMLIHSSNIKADALYQHMERVAASVPLLNLSSGRWLYPLLSQIDGYRSDFVINDGSGLSPDNRLTAHFLVSLLRYAWEREDMRRILLDEALATPAHPVRHGSLLGRMSAPLYRNKIFVKTGTLTTIGLSSLAGYAQAADGRWLIFAIINENSPVAESRIFQDHVCKELVR